MAARVPSAEFHEKTCGRKGQTWWQTDHMYGPGGQWYAIPSILWIGTRRDTVTLKRAATCFWRNSFSPCIFLSLYFYIAIVLDIVQPIVVSCLDASTLRSYSFLPWRQLSLRGTMPSTIRHSVFMINRSSFTQDSHYETCYAHKQSSSSYNKRQATIIISISVVVWQCAAAWGLCVCLCNKMSKTLAIFVLLQNEGPVYQKWMLKIKTKLSPKTET